MLAASLSKLLTLNLFWHQYCLPNIFHKFLHTLYMYTFNFISLYKSASLSVSLFVCSLTPPKRRGEPQRAEILKNDFPWDGEGFKLKNIRIRRTVSRKIACIVGMYTSDSSGQFYSLQYESLTYLGGC